MSEVKIPQASLERLRMTYGQFEQLAAVVAEAMGLPPGQVQSINLPGGTFVVNDGETPELSHERENGVTV